MWQSFCGTFVLQQLFGTYVKNYFIYTKQDSIYIHSKIRMILMAYLINYHHTSVSRIDFCIPKPRVPGIVCTIFV